MIINLVPDSSVASAPPGFAAAMEQAAQILEKLVTDNITINIAYGWGTYDNQPLPVLDGANLSVGGYLNGRFESYGTVKSWLAGSATSALDLAAIAALPASDTAFPNAHNLFIVTSAEEKALGHYMDDPSALDGAIGFGTGTDAGFWLGAALHEMTHAMGRISGYSTSVYADMLDMFRFSGPGAYQWAGGKPAYFSIDNGVTDLANFSTVSDYGDFANDSLTPFDSFDAFVTGSSLTPADMKIIDAIGFNIGTPLTVGAGQSQIVSGARLTGAIARDGGTLRIVSGGATRMTTVGAGGNEVVLSGGHASGTVVSSGGAQIVSGGAAFDTSLLSGAAGAVLHGGVLSAGEIGSGGALIVSSGGAAISATVAAGGSLTVRNGGTARGTILLSGAEETLRGQGVAHGTVIDEGATQIISSGGIAIGAQVSSGGTQSVTRGGMGSATVVSDGGAILVSAGGMLRGAVVESGGTLSAGPGSARNATIRSGGTLIFAGGAVTGLTADSGAQEEIAAGATASGLTVSAGVILTVSSRATATQVHVLSGGMLVYDRGAVRDARIDSGGIVTVASGVTAVGLTAGDGVTLEVASGATARLPTLAGGTGIVAAGGAIGGPVTFTGNSTLVLASAAGTAPKLSGFDATDRLDLQDFAFSGAEHASFAELPGKHRGVLTLTDGSLSVSVTLFGQYAAQGFRLAGDGNGGTAITYAAPTPFSEAGIGLAVATGRPYRA